MITLLGPTASGKTTFAVHLAKEINGEIISGDSRQVYRGMDLGTGKDLADYEVGGVSIPHHLIDIADAGEKYNVYRFKHDFITAYDDITARGKTPILCGGTGLYIESVLRNYNLPDVPANTELRQSLAGKSLAELTAVLETYKTLHNTTDVDTPQRAIRAIEIAEYEKTHPAAPSPQIAPSPETGGKNIVFGLSIDRDLRRQRISQRLRQRLEQGMADEIRKLLAAGVPPEDLLYYGLEYKYVTLHVLGRIDYRSMFEQLEIAIHQFAKRQMTWFRGMERRGVKIHWIEATLPMEEKLETAKSIIEAKDSVLKPQPASARQD